MKGLPEAKMFSQLLKTLKCSSLAGLLFPKDIEKRINLLGENYERYYLKKIKLSGGLLLVGFIILLGYVLWYQLGSVSEIKEIPRPETYDQSTEVVLEMMSGQEDYQIEVFPQELSKEQADALFEELSWKLVEIIRGDNQNLEHVTRQLFLPEYIDPYPFNIYWESDKEDIVDSAGMINRYGLSEDEIVILTGVFYYKDWIWEVQLPVNIAKEELTAEDQQRRELQKLLQEGEQIQRGEAVFELPQVIGDRQISFGIRKTQDSVLFLAILIIITAIILWLGQDNDLRRMYNQNKKVFEDRYVSFISKLSLYISAGVTLPAAMNLYIKDYMERKPMKDIFYEAIFGFNKDIQNGLSFSLAIQKFADKTAAPSYRRIAGIFQQSIINGSRGLASTLEEEVLKIQEERKRKSKIKGEEISTALIAPMMLQLGVVIALVMIPAFMNMQF